MATGHSQKASPSSSSLSRALRGPRLPGFVLSSPGRPDRSSAGGFSRSRDDRDAGGRSHPRRNTDRDALALREQGHSFAVVARTVGLKRAADARQAFLRELRSLPEEERQPLVARELQRLDELETRIRARDAEQPDKLQTRLGALAAMRESLG